MRRAAIAPLLLLLLLPCGAAGAAQISTAVNPRVAHPLGRLLGAIPVGGVSLPLHARLVPRGDAGPQPPPPSTNATCPSAASFALCTYGGPVLHANNVYTIFWAPPGLSFPPGYINRVNAYFAGQAADSGTRGNVYSTDTQYYDSGGNAGYQSTFAGTNIDTSAFPVLSCVQLGFQCVSDTDLTSELDRVIANNGWPRGLGPTYFVFLPQGASVCANSIGATQCAYQVFCAYHSAYSLGGGPPTLYSVEAYAAVAGCDSGESPNATSADAVINTASHEHNEMITDPLGDGWLDRQGLENGDKCASAYGPPLGGRPGAQFNQLIGGGDYYLQEEFSNFSIQPTGSPDNGCAQSLPARPPTADFAVATNPPLVGAPVTFNATVSDPDSTVSSISWDFGDGTAPGSGPSVTHVYRASGPHTVTLGVVDALGLSTQVSHPIQVLTPAPQAAFTAAPNPARSGRAVRFDGSASNEPGGAITAWAWSFGDGTQASGPLVSHVFRGAGPRTVTLLVSDSLGASNSTAHRIDVAHGLLTSFGVVRGQTVRSVQRRGLRVRVRCSRRCRVSARVELGAVHRRNHARHGGVVLVRLSGSAARALHKRHGRLTLTVAVAAGSQRDSASRLVRLRP